MPQAIFEADIISTGSELTFGQLVDTNSAWIANLLSRSGVRIRRITIVGDRISDIASVLTMGLKEKRKLILVPRETPWSLIHARNITTLIEAGATVLPASPSFYSRPRTVEEAADTVVFRILDHLDIPHPAAYRWQSNGK